MKNVENWVPVLLLIAGVLIGAIGTTVSDEYNYQDKLVKEIDLKQHEIDSITYKLSERDSNLAQIKKYFDNEQSNVDTFTNAQILLDSILKDL